MGILFKIIRIKLLLSIFAIPLLISVFIEPDYSHYEFKIDQLQGEFDIDLPIVKWMPNSVAVDGLVVEGAAFLTFKKGDYIYIPYLDGRLKVELNGREVETSNSAIIRYGISRRSEFILDLSEFEPQPVNVLGLKLYKTSSAFPSLSEIYVLNGVNLNLIKRYTDLVDEKIKTVSYGAVISQLILLFVMVRLSVISEKIIHSLIILSFFAFMGLVRFLDAYEDIAKIMPYFWLMSPLVFISTLTSIAGSHPGRLSLIYLGERTKRYLQFGLVLSPVILLCISFFVEIRLINIVISAPLLFFSMLFGFLSTLKMYWYKRNVENYLFVLAYSCSILFFTHDVLVRLGVFHSGLLMSGYISIFFIVAVYYYFVKTLKASQLAVKFNEVVLLDKLALQEEKLIKEYETTQALQVSNAENSATQKLYMDLHDGVLNYISIINSLSSAPISVEMVEISRVSRLASAEIRIILSQNTLIEKSLLAALVTFKAQTLDGLKHVGVDVFWDMSELANYRLVETAHLIEIYRIIQEVTHNAVHRAQCKILIFKGSKLLDGTFLITVSNMGGKTFRKEMEAGLGFSNIKMRARRIAGNFLITSINGGAKFELYLPIGQCQTKLVEADRATP